jgi:hypothetical protein
MGLAFVGLASVLLPAIGCLGHVVDPVSADAGDAGISADAGTTSGDASALPLCSWPASLDPTDADNGQCVAARVLLACAYANGDGEGCISDDPTQCPGPPLLDGAFTCHDQCEPGEYAIRCGQIPPPPRPPALVPGGGLPPGSSAPPAPPPPPAGCRNMETTPAGIWFECCPCGS